MYSIEFEINDLPTLVNAQSKAHWAIQYREAKKWKQWVALFCLGKAPPSPLKRAKIEFTRHSSRAPDADNLAHSFKHCLDGLKLAKIIEDDSPRHVELEYKWSKAPVKNGKICIKVVESTL